MELSHVTWRTSSYSGSNGNCVEVAAAARVVAVRDSKNPAGRALPFGPAEWQAFTRRIKRGRADRA